MKYPFTTLIILFLTGCATANSQWTPQNFKQQEVIDTTSQAAYYWLVEEGYPDALIVGRRSEDCFAESIAGYGVVIKKLENGKPNAISGVICQSMTGDYELFLDKKVTDVQ